MDERDKIVISMDKHFIERLVYWIIILILAVLLIIAWMKDCDGTEAVQTAEEDEETDVDTPAANTTQNTTQAVAAPASSCADGLKNGNETGVDCGGSCTKCATGQACGADADCISGICANSTCVTTRPVTLSGKLELDVKGVTTTKAASDAYKVTGISYTIKNGLAEDMEGFIAKVYIKNTAGTRCYNQQIIGTCDDSYAEFTIPALKSGKSVTTERPLQPDDYTSRVGNFIVDDNGDNPAKFSVVVYLYDENGQEINDKSLSDVYQVS